MANLLDGKKVKLTLVGLDGNAFSLMGAFSKAARREGWSKEEIKTVMNACQSGDYDNLISVLMDHCDEDDEEEEGEYDDDEEDEVPSFPYKEKLRVAINYISEIAGGIGWDDLADINSLHVCYTVADIEEYCNDRLEDAGFPVDDE